MNCVWDVRNLTVGENVSLPLALDRLREMQHEEQAAVLLATHDEMVAAAADRVLHLMDGRIVS